MESLKRTLDFLGLDLSDVVHVKSFLHPVSAAAEVEKRIAAFFGDAAPPQVFVEWTSQDRIEIELIAAARSGQGGAPIEYLTPPEFTASPVYAKVVRAAHPATIYISGLYPPAGGDAAAQIKDLFAQLTGILGRTGSDLRHLAKATYYVASDDTSRLLNQLRPDYYDPRRPPAASKAGVAGTGLRGRDITMDMIAVPAQ
jgi:enamine deaminase RidA (YjgF/YER057c/UK114 family)